MADLPIDIHPYSFSEGLARFSKEILGNEKWGYIDTTGKIVIQPIFDGAYDFSDSMAIVSRTDTAEFTTIGSIFGYINKRGKIVIKLQYDRATDFSNGLAIVRKHFYSFGIDKKGNTIFFINNFLAGDGWLPSCKFSEGLARGKFWQTDRKIKGAFIDTTGNVAISINFEHAGNFRNGLCRIWLENSYGEWSYIDKSGKIIFSPNMISDTLKKVPRRFGIQ